MDDRERMMQQVRGLRELADSRYGRERKNKKAMVYDFLSIFHPEMSEEDKLKVRQAVDDD